VIKPVNLEALTKWVGHIPEDVVNDMANIAPMLSILGEHKKKINAKPHLIVACF
jgi:hypothetical protein